jgi:hypothetical protein
MKQAGTLRKSHQRLRETAMAPRRLIFGNILKINRENSG